MPEVNDVDLMELADGMLSEPRRSVVEAEISADPELQARFQAFLVTGKALARLFDPVADAPVPERLTSAVLQGAASLPRRPLAHARSSASERLKNWLAARSIGWRLPPAAVLASLVCVAGVGAAIFWMLQKDRSFMGLAPQQLAAALEATPSDRVADLTLAGGKASIRPELSFQNVDGRYCRQYYLALESRQAFSGYACRTPSGEWNVEMDAPAPVRRDAGSGEVRPASADTVKAVEDAVHAAMAGDAIQADREQELILKHWRADR